VEVGPKLEGDAHHRHGPPKRKKRWHTTSQSARRAADEANDLEKGRKGGNGNGGPAVALSGVGPAEAHHSSAERSAYARGAVANASTSGSESTQSARSTPYTPGPMSHNVMGNSHHTPQPLINPGTRHYPHRMALRPEVVAENEKPRDLRDFWTRDV